MKAKAKKKLYLTLWLVFGGILGFLFGSLFELYFAFQGNNFDSFIFIYLVFTFLGFIHAVWLGPIAWRKIYVEGARGNKYIVKEEK